MESRAAVLPAPIESHEFESERPVVFETLEVPAPEGEEVLVEIAAASVCHTDAAIVAGKRDERYPLVLGHEGAGIVKEVGDEVETVSPGDHVVLGRIACGMCRYCRTGLPNLCRKRRETTHNGSLRTGAVRFSRQGEPRYHCHGVSSFSEYTIVTQEVAIPITKQLPLEMATLLGCGVFTGAGAVWNTAGVEPGDVVAIFGAGGVGLSAIQAARICGAAEIIAIDLVPEKLERAAQLGATSTIVAGENDVVEVVRERTGGVDYAFDVVGDATVIEQAVSVLQPRGEAILVGTVPPGSAPVSVDYHDLVLGEKAIKGSFNGSCDLSLFIPKLAELATTGALSLSPLITNERPLDELNEALQDLVSGDEIRQVIIL